MTIDLHNQPRSSPTWTSVILGALLMMQFVIVCTVKSAQGIPGEVLWMSHVALAFAGGGLLLGSNLLTGAALTSIAITHSLWLFDFAAALVIGEHPLNITRYLDNANLLTWASTTHHFYLLPVLLVVVLRSARYSFGSFALAALLIVIVTLVSRAALPPALNVNFAFTILPGIDLAPLRWANSLPPAGYLLVQITWQIIVLMLPTALFLRYVTRNNPSSCTYLNIEHGPPTTSPAAIAGG